MNDKKEYFGKIPPQNIEAELYLLASILIDNRSYDKVILQKINYKDFYDEKHQNIFKGIEELNKKGRPIDIITLNEILKSMNLLELSGGTEYISSLIDRIPTSANIEYYAEIVKSKSMLRQLIFAANDIISESLQQPEDVKSLIDNAEKKIFDINQDFYSTDITLIKNILKETIEDIHKGQLLKGEISGIPSGFHELDEKTDGFQKQEMIVIAARPGMGKTSFGLNIVTNAAIKYKKRVGIFSCEMNKKSLTKRMICSEASIDEMKMRKGFLTKIEENRMFKAAENLYETIILIDDTPNIPMLELRSKARKMKKDYNIDLLLIDYLQLITTGDELAKNTPRHEQIAYISRSIKSLARQLDIPIIALAQLNRNLETRGEDSKPKLSDLKDSGSIEQDADVIIFIHNKVDSNKDEQEQDNDNEKKIVNPLAEPREIIIGKNRNGPTDTVKMVFLKNFTKFESIAKY